MTAKKYYSFLTLFFIGILCINLLHVQVARADEGTPTEPPAPTEVVTEPAAEPSLAPVEEQPVTEEPTAAPVTEPPEEIPAPQETLEEPPSAAVSIEGLENTEIVVLDEQGEALVLGSQEAVNALGNSDPVWCPESVTTPTPGANGCTVSYASITEILAAMQAYPDSFSQNGTIFLEQTSGAGFTTPLVLDDSSESLGPSFNSLSIFNLTIQGGWDPATGSTSNQTVFSGPNAYLQIGSLSNPWLGSLSINNVTVTGASQDGIQIFASSVALTNVSSTYSGANGISITANESGTVALNNVNASHNGHLEGSEHVGSGVYIAGATTLIEVAGGTFIDNTRYGIEAMNSISSSLQHANLWTDQEDYAPGSVVTISGNSNSLNGNNTGFLFGEAIHVAVQGPNGYTATCEATANSFGGWSCQITLWGDDLAIGDYTYTAVGLSSGISETGTFKDGKPNTVTVAQNSPGSVTAGNSATYTITITFNGNSDPCTASLSVNFQGSPAGVSGSFSPASVSSTGLPQTATLTVNTTSATPAGQITFTVTATGQNGCQNGQPAQGNGTLNVTAAPTNTPTSTPTNTSVPPTNTPTSTPTSTPTNTQIAPTNTPTSTPTNTTVPPTNTPTSTPTSTQVPPTNTPTSTPTNTSVPPTNTPTSTPTNTQVAATNTPTNTPTNTSVAPTNTPTSTPTNTSVPVTNTPTSTPTNTQIGPTNTPTNTATSTPASAPTSTPTTTKTPVTGSTSASSGPKPSPTTSSSAFVIPLTGGELIKLDCNTVLWAFGIKLTFYNLCDEQTSLHSVGETELPSQLPDGYTYLRGLKVDILTNGQKLDELPANSGIEMDFPTNRQPRNQFVVLYWNDPDGDGKGNWIELSQQKSFSKISELLGTTSGDELYQLILNTASGFYPTLTTEKTGIFILVKK